MEALAEDQKQEGSAQPQRGTAFPNEQKVQSTLSRELLRTLFTHSEFLRFLERLLFDDGFKVTFESVEESYLEHNRGKLLQFMNKRKIYTSARGLRL